MYIKNESTEAIETDWEGEKIEQVDCNKYLGVYISSDGRLDEKVNNRIEKASAANYNFYNLL